MVSSALLTSDWKMQGGKDLLMYAPESSRIILWSGGTNALNRAFGEIKQAIVPILAAGRCVAFVIYDKLA